MFRQLVRIATRIESRDYFCEPSSRFSLVGCNAHLSHGDVGGAEYRFAPPSVPHGLEVDQQLRPEPSHVSQSEGVHHAEIGQDRVERRVHLGQLSLGQIGSSR